MAELYLFEEGSNKYGFTAGLFAETFGGTTYAPTVITRGRINQTDNFAKSPLNIRFERSHGFAQRILNDNFENAILVTVFRNGFPYWKGRVIKPKGEGPYIDIYCESIFAASAKAGAQVTISSQCWKLLYSAQCGVDKATYASVHTPIFLDDYTISIPTITQASGYFSGGFALLGSEERHIAEQNGTIVTIFSPFTTTTGSITLYPGCDLTEATCANKFNNRVNHIGFSRIPNKNPFGPRGLL